MKSIASHGAVRIRAVTRVAAAAAKALRCAGAIAYPIATC